ncbi:DNA mismatch repair protein MutS [bacterium]|nr:DNA mismatch repair protein MutS [bacterium]
MENITPMLKQYNAIKEKYPDCILFFRLGDFYEMFYDDAKVASKILDLVLTSRSAGKSGKVPMCGIPYHAADTYISRLIKAGKKVAICEQIEDPSKAKGIVKREVVRVITTGTYIDENTPDTRYLSSIFYDKKRLGIAFIDSGGGTIFTNQFDESMKIVEIFQKIPVYECIFPENQEEKIREVFSHPLLKIKNITLTPSPEWFFNFDMARETLLSHFKVSNLSGFGIEYLPLSIRCCGAIIEYLKEINKSPLSHIDRISLYSQDDFVYISPSAFYGLEIDKLFDILDKTETAMGKRTLKYWVYHPLINIKEIELRQDFIEEFLKDRNLREKIAGIIKEIPDVEKALSKISCGYGGVKDILAIKKLLEKVPDIKKLIDGLCERIPLFKIKDIPELRNLLENAISPDIPVTNFEGKVIKKGFNEEIDSLREIKEKGREYLRNLQEREIKRTGITSLKIGYNKVFGYYIEVTKPNLHLVPPDYIRKQTLVNAERFVTPELKEFEEKVITAEERILEIEQKILEKIKEEILKESFSIHSLTSAISTLDALISLARVAEEEGYNRPEVNDGFVIEIKDGRHPVVEKMIEEEFIPNDAYVDCEKEHLLIITGPNMAGKSTYIRQVAVIVIMAQIGSFVPAKKAIIGYVDKIFTRIGARDEITKGQSTFMVEMAETAEILHNLSKRSLIILDEIGRGTSTYDGFSLAWAVAEYLQKEKVRTLFATHFHEITGLARKYKGVKNYNVAVKREGDNIIFLHKIVDGSADESYGIYVAKLAGIPENVVRRGQEILSKLELQGALQDKIIGEVKVEYPSLFPEEEKSPVEEIKEDVEKYRKIKEEIAQIDINRLTPIEALLKLKELKEKLEDGKG